MDMRACLNGRHACWLKWFDTPLRVPRVLSLLRPGAAAPTSKHHGTAQAHSRKTLHPAPPVGSADALLLARLGEREKAAGRVTAIVTADASDAQRLIDEMAFFAPGLRCALFPDWETLPYDSFSPHQDLISERLATLWRINQRDKEHGADVVLVPATTALYRLAPPSFLAGYTFEFKSGQKLDEAKLKAQLTLAGYQHVSQVVSHGEYAVRGGLIDLFPMGSLQPYRVDLFDDEIDSIRTFDPDTQRSLYPVPEVRLLPGREFPMDEDARAKFRHRWRELLEGDPTRSRIYKDMGQGIATAGIEYYLPLFFDETATVFDYLGADATVVMHGDLEPAFQRFWQDTKALPPGAGRPRAPGPAARGAVPVRRPVLHARQGARPARAAPRHRGRGRQRHLPEAGGPVRGARRRGPAGAAAKAHCRQRPPRPAAGRVRWPPRKPAGLLPRLGREPAGLRLAGRVPGRCGREGGHCHGRADERLRMGGGRPGLRHRDRAVRHQPHGPQAPPAGAGQRCGGADQGPVRTQGGRPRGALRTTASAATRAWSTWTWARRTRTARRPCRNSCTWSTRATPCSTCPSASCS